MQETTKGMADAMRHLPDQIEAELRGVGDADLRRRPAPEEWSILETCGHVRDAVEIEALRIRALATQQGATLPAFDGHEYLRQRFYNLDEPKRVLAALRANCAFAADVLAGLSDSDLQRSGTHEEAGPVTVGSRAEGLTDHGRDHLQQIQDTKRSLKA